MIADVLGLSAWICVGTFAALYLWAVWVAREGRS